MKNHFQRPKKLLEGWVKPTSLIPQVLHAPSEGIGINATCRVFDLAQNILLNWENKFSSLKQRFMIKAMWQEHLVQWIEGKELDIKVKKGHV